jgi:putative oxidoreductase
MNSIQRNLLAAARVLVALIFLANGFGIIPQAVPMKDLADHGTPATLVPFVILAGRSIQIVAGVALLLGIYPQVAALMLIAFMVPATLIAHDFWHAVGSPAYVPLLLQFLKNTAIIGGLLFMAAAPNQPALFPRTSRSKDR